MALELSHNRTYRHYIHNPLRDWVASSPLLSLAYGRARAAVQPTLSRIFNSSDVSLVAERLYLGDFSAAANLALLQRLRVTHVVCAVRGVPALFEPGIAYELMDLRDVEAQSMEGQLEPALRFIDAALASGGTVLVHCMAGRSRSATVVVAHLMRRHGVSCIDRCVSGAHPSAVGRG